MSSEDSAPSEPLQPQQPRRLGPGPSTHRSVEPYHPPPLERSSGGAGGAGLVPSAGGGGGGGSGIDSRRILAAVLRFKWVVLLVTGLGTAVGVWVSRRTDPTYQVRATLWVDVPDARTRDQGPIQSGQLLGSSGWADLLESRVVLDDVVRALRLYLSPEIRADSAALASLHVRDDVRPGRYRLTVAADSGLTLSTDDGEVLEHDAVGDSVGAALGFLWVPPAEVVTPGRTIAFMISSPAAVAQALTGQVRVHTDLVEGKVGNFMRLELRGTDPGRITAIVNAIAERFVAVAADLKRQKLTALVAILAEQVRHAQQNLAQAERALKDFRVGAVTLLSGDAAPALAGTTGRDPAFANFFEMRLTREQMRRDREMLERLMAQVPDSGLPVDALEASAAVQHSSALSLALKELTDKQALLRALRYRYTEQHPPVRRLAQDVATLERQTIPTLVQALVAQLAARESEAGREVDSAAGGLRQIPPLAIQQVQLQRDVTIAEQLFSNLQQRYEEARLAEVSSIPEVSILDRAVQGQAPVFDIAPLVVVLALLGSLVSAVLGVVVLDRFDPRVRYPDQVTEAMGLSILGAVPHVGRRTAGKKKEDDEIAPVIEALRAIRLAVVHAHGTAGPVLVTISSPGRSDGKSFVASNLALAFADAGYRTLLIDGDIRRGTLHRVLSAARKPGLTELLAGTATREQVIRTTRYPSLWFIGCGARTQVGPELLTSAPMARLITSLRPSYDTIIVDSPPLAAGADAFALGTMTGALLLVLRSGVSNRDLAEAKLNVLDRLPVRVLGAVLNDVRLSGEYKYYSYYLAGYEVDEEEPAFVGRPVRRDGD